MTYKKIVELLDGVIELLPEGVSLAKGGVGEIALAHHLGHTVVKGDKGADGMDEDGNKFEYKISTTDQFNFHFGARKEGYEEVIFDHFENIEGAYCAKRVGMKITDVVYVPSYLLVPALILHFKGTVGGQLNKCFGIKTYKALKTHSNNNIPGRLSGIKDNIL